MEVSKRAAADKICFCCSHEEWRDIKVLAEVGRMPEKGFWKCSGIGTSPSTSSASAGVLGRALRFAMARSRSWFPGHTTSASAESWRCFRSWHTHCFASS